MVKREDDAVEDVEEEGVKIERVERPEPRRRRHRKPTQEEIRMAVSEIQSLATSRENVIDYIKQLIYENAKMRSELRKTKKILAKVLTDAMYKGETIEVLNTMLDTSTAMFKLTLDRLSLMMSTALESSVRTQELAVKYAETSQTNVAIVEALDRLRALITKYVPYSELDKAEELLLHLARASKILQPITPTRTQTTEKKGGQS
ncbi:hypothetical protein DRO54_10215 [Candidatus Bathyarchaeota archaeon]|nr:MAG: hypothetical protein DRO54_10215 [Candidatus Bathyarchaeota archaeon]